MVLDLVDLDMLCVPCAESGDPERANVAAEFIAGQSANPQDFPIKWKSICGMCAQGWYDGSDWIGPMYQVMKVPTTTAFVS